MGELRFMISEAAKQVDVETHVLRYWEDELDLTIDRTEMGHRYYTEEDIQLFSCIKKLKDAGMPLKELKALIPELKQTKERLQKISVDEAKSEEAVPLDSPEAEENTELSITTTAEITTGDKLEQVRSLIGDVLTDVVTSNNEALKKEISFSVTTDVIKEMGFLFQAKERQEEEHFRKLDCLIRQQQTLRKESTKTSSIGRLKKMLT